MYKSIIIINMNHTQDRNRRFALFRFNPSGQALIEYLLVLIVTVSLLGGAIYQLNDSFKKFLESYFGDYLSCLIEAGELPKLGGESEGICEDQFEAFSLANGRPPIEKSSTSQSKDKSDSSGQVVGPVTHRAGSDGNFGKGLRPHATNASSFEKDGLKDDGRESQDQKKSMELLNVGGRKNQISNKSQLRQKYFAGVLQEDDFLKDKKKKKKKSAITNIEDDGESTRKVTKVVIKKRNVAKVEGEEGFSVGDFIRYLIIIGIILAIVIFVGSQIMQISKNWD